MTTLYMATISHRHGENHYYAKSEAGLTAQIFAYVAENWDQEMPEGFDMPILQSDAVDKYFETHADRLGEEFVSYNSTQLNSIPE